jgi:hypothetical protein
VLFVLASYLSSSSPFHSLCSFWRCRFRFLVSASDSRRRYQDSIFRSPTDPANLSACGSRVRICFFWVRALSLFAGESGLSFGARRRGSYFSAVDFSGASNFVHRVSFPGSGNPARPGLSPLEGIILFYAKAAARPSWIHPCRPVPAWDFFGGLCLSARLLFHVRVCAKGTRFFLLFGPRVARCLGDFVFQQQRQLRVLLR